ncbi:Acyltransferase 3 [unidentified eubacterium SCB49]|nr:Acyltransferase 3 [unidentified eubacterium SCB49]
MDKRLQWIDQARGFSIFLVVWGHNFPTIEPYIYSFHVPLFFFIAGMFHPEQITVRGTVKRAKMILIPYFIWATALYLFWLFVGRHYGDSSEITLSPIDNLIGVFYAQGGQQYMDWGIPLWFLPCIFLVYFFFGILKKIKNTRLYYISVAAVVLLGILWTKIIGIKLPWSIDVAMVALAFYCVGNVLKAKMISVEKKKSILWFLFLFAAHIGLFLLNTEKIDMYRSIYGIPTYFLLSGLCGSIAYVLFFKLVPIFKPLSYLGKNSIVILATHLRALTVIKLILLLVLGITVFQFSEIEKFILSIFQILLAIPIIWFVNKYIPIANGTIKKK